MIDVPFCNCPKH